MKRIFGEISYLYSRILYKGLSQQKVTMKIDEEMMKHIQRPGLQELICIFQKYGYGLRIVGGPVRDLLMGLTPHDLDFATTATPTEMKEFFEKENVRLINNRGESHGTITARIQDTNFECTTLRLDKNPDGRHTEVTFITDWELDAKRRDLTVNAMYLGFDGTVYDYFNSIEDLKNRQVLFVGNASDRIKEDYLRILRYFRFFGRISDSGIHSEDVIESIKENKHGLSVISSERIFLELKKITTGRLGNEMLAEMKNCGLFPYIGLSEDFNIDNFHIKYKICDLENIKPVCLLAAGFLSLSDARTFMNKVKCSNKDKDALHFIMQNREMDFCENNVLSLQVDLKYKSNFDNVKIKQLFTELMLYNGIQMKDIKELTKLPKFPVNGNHLFGVQRKFRKKKLADLVDIWKKSNYTMTSPELLACL